MPGMQLRICHLYPELMNIYGDRGNVITMVKRCIWRDIAVTVTDITLGEAIDPADFDFFFIGGGQDREQILVCDDLSGDKGQAVRQAVEDGASLLAICGGYQLLGKYFLTYTGEDLPGISLFDVKTVGGDTRFIGNIAVDCEADGIRAQPVGFENHSGRHRPGPEARPLGRVIKGYGNNGEDGTEGCVYKSAVGSYLHGSLLPKNPRLADWFILRSLRRKYELEELPGLDDALENAARDAALQFTMKEKRFRKRFGR